MKKIATIIALVGLALTVNAQLRLDNAKNYGSQKKGYYDKAKIEIDAACVEEGTKNNPEVWAWKGWIYVNLGLSDKPKMKKVCPENWADIAYEAALKSKELNVEKQASIITMNNEVFKIVAGRYVDEAFTLYNNNPGNDTDSYRKCVSNIDKAIKIFQSSGSEDPDIKDRVKEARYIGGAAARVIGDNETVIKMYKPLVRSGYNQNYVYTSLASIYQVKGDTIEAMKVAKTYTEKHPENQSAFLLAAKVSAWAGNAQKTLEYAKTALEKAETMQDATQKSNLICSVADIYTDLPDYEEAEKQFKSALEIAPNNPMVYNGLGRMKFNHGQDLGVKANDVPLTDETGLYEKLQGEMKAKYAEAETYYKKSLEINDRSTDELKTRYTEALKGLTMVYARSNKNLDELKVYEK